MSFDYERYAPFHDWHEPVTDDAKAIAALMGWQIERVYFTGFWSQGDGACFEGTFGYAKGCAKAVREYAPSDTELHQIADAWQALQRRAFYCLAGRVRHSGHYYHEHCTAFTWEDCRDSWRALPDGVEDEAAEIARDFMRWIYRQLEREYEYQFAWSMASAWQDCGEAMQDARAKARDLVREMRQAIRSGVAAGNAMCAALRSQLRAYLSDWEEQREERDAIAANFHYRQDGKSLSVVEFAKVHL